MRSRIHINQHNLRANKKRGTSLPVITVKDYKRNRLANRAEIVDKEGKVVATLVYSPQKPLSCGAHVWVETALEVRLDQDSAAPSCSKRVKKYVVG